MRALLLLFAVFAAGCVSSSETFTSDGRKGHLISCPSTTGLVGAMTSWGTCFQRAGDICGTKGYTVLQRSDEAGFAAAVNQYGGYAGTTTNRAMIVRCNDGAPPMPTAQQTRK